MKVKKLFIWMLGAVSTLVVIAYLSVEVLLQSSYENFALDKYSAAAANSTRAAVIAQFLYPATSRHYQGIFLHDVKVWSLLGKFAGSAVINPMNDIVVKTLAFEEKNAGVLTREEMARIQVEVARIANAMTHGEGVSLVLRLIDKSPSTDDLWLAYAEEEQAYTDLAGFLAVLASKNSRQRNRNDVVVESAIKAHKAAQEKICKSDVARCRFNNLRWEIGTCIRQAYLNEEPACSPETLRHVTNFAGTDISKGLTVDQCYEVMNSLLPYYHALLQAQGKDMLNLLSIEAQLGKRMPKSPPDKR